jgi:hypothetical protein
MFQPLIDQGRTVWLWPDMDGRNEWQEVADKLGSEKVRVYTKFFDTCWCEEDGTKADVADIAIRMMRNPDFKPREIQTDVKGVTDQNAAAVSDNGAALDALLTPEQQEKLAVDEWVAVHEDEPFIDPIELTDMRVAQWREILRQRYNFNKSRK